MQFSRNVCKRKKKNFILRYVSSKGNFYNVLFFSCAKQTKHHYPDDIWLISFGQKLIICLAFLSNQFGQTARFQCKYSPRDVKQLPDQFIDQSILSITCIAWSEPYMIFILQALNTCTSNSYKLHVDDLDP